MDNSFENQILVDETKGLLGGLEINARQARYGLSFDTLGDLVDDLDRMKLIIDRIQNKIENKISSCDKDELY